MITYILIAITVIVSIICFSNRSLFYKLSLSPYNIVRKNEWYRLVTHAFLHADYTHLFINMLVLWSFGTSIERLFGSLFSQGHIENYNLNFLLLYFGAIIFSSIPDLLTKRNQYAYNSIGASGAVSAILFASIVFNPWNKILFFGILPIPSIIFGVLYVIYESYMDQRGSDNINHKAHLWGAIYGVVFLIAMEPKILSHFITELLNPRF